MARDAVQVVGIVGVFLVPLTVGIASWRLIVEMRESRTQHTAQLATLTKQLESARTSKWVALKDTTNNCYADNTNVTCTVTNMRDEAITTCLQGRLTQKKAGGIGLSSLAICTGRLGPKETRTTIAPWVGGFARDLCHSADRWGNEVLDWQACDFTTLPVEPEPVPVAAK